MSGAPICKAIVGGEEINVTTMVVVGRYQDTREPATVRFLDTTSTPYTIRASRLRTTDGQRMTADEINALSMQKEVQAS